MADFKLQYQKEMSKELAEAKAALRVPRCPMSNAVESSAVSLSVVARHFNKGVDDTTDGEAREKDGERLRVHLCDDVCVCVCV